MPFTFSHPAAVLPIRASVRWMSMSALVLGSMAPDFAYFLPFVAWGRFSHSLSGIFGFCVPTGLLAYVIFHKVVKEPMWSIAPWVIRCRIDPAHGARRLTSPPALLMIVGSLMTGALTHVAWDGFTHKSGAFVHLFEWLAMVIPLGGNGIPLYKLLQHASSIFGLTVLLLATYRWVKKSPVLYRQRVGASSRDTTIVLFLLASVGVGGMLIGLLYSHALSLERMLFKGIIYGIGSTANASLLYSVFVQFKSRSRCHNV
jgi:hypothetical protein